MLSSLELFGFKSFADRTLFEFSPGITCVVGPNGSGKSNVVDAIKWILGDQSAKSLRGKEMADVIFNGSTGRKPSGFAEATLAFDNSSGFLPVPDAEVRVGRRLYRSGDSEYLLNGAVVRLKDVRDLFLGTGAGTAAYSIIEQGRVDQILQANPTARRLVFEEAAGVSRYRTRKQDAERKLEKVAQNLLRLTDIVDEVEVQLSATRSQATKAAKFRELSTELKELWTGLAADDHRQLSRELSEYQAAGRRQAEAIEQLLAQIARAEAGRAEAERQLAQLDDELRHRERRLAGVREQIAAHESTIRHQTARDGELTTEVERLRVDRTTLTAQAAAVGRDLEETRTRLEEFEKRIARQREALSQRNRQCEELAAAAGRLEADARSRNEEREQLRLLAREGERDATRLASQVESVDRTLEDVQRQLDRLDQTAAEAEAELRSRQSRVAEAEALHAAAQAESEQLRLRRQELRAEQAHFEQRLAELREQRSAAVSRIHVLEDLERRQEGISIGVQEILRRAHDAPHPPWNEILGSVSDLVQVSLEHAPLIEVALGPRSQLVVVRRLRPILDYLNRQAAPISGRVGFIELGREPRTSGVSAIRTLELLGQAGVVCRADELIEEIEDASGLAAQLLGDTWVVESLETAVGLQAAYPGCRLVTQQGELIETDGAVYGGTIPNTTALVSRRSELRNLKHSVIRIDRDLERQTEAAEALTATLEQVEQQVVEAESRAVSVVEQLTSVRGRAESQQREVDRIAAEAARTSDLQIEQEQQRSDLLARIEQVQQQQQDLQQRGETLDRDAARTNEQLTGVAAELNGLRNQLREQQLELAKHEERLTGLRDSLTRLTSEQTQRIARREQAEARLSEVLQSRRQTRLTILRTRDQLAHGFLAAEDLAREVAAAAREHRSCRSRSAALSREEEQLHQLRRKRLDEQHQTEMQIRDRQRNLLLLEERILEEYQVPLAEFIAQGASAFRKLLQERYPDSQFPGASSDASSAPMDETVRDEGDVLPAGPADRQAASEAETLAENGQSVERCLPELPPPIDAEAPVSFADVRGELEEQVNRLRRKLKMLGNVNTDALLELDDLDARFTALSTQRQDLEEAKIALEEIIRRINKESRRIFLETFETIRGNFRELFRKVFGGGEGDIILEDAENVLECGIDIVARPPGKELRSISLLSGGEKTMTAVALLFAMFRSKPSPYCILDEVDAALDDANVDRYVSIVEEFARQTQFVIITHRKRTMTAASVLYGVTMEQAGVSKRMSVRFEDVSDDGHIKTRNAA